MVAARRLIALLAALAAVLASPGSAFAATYSSPSPITISDNQPANPYPSAIAVSGLSGEITDVNVRLRGISHTCLDDLGIVLEAPSGQTLLLMNGVGPVAACPDSSAGVSNIDLTLDDAAATQLQDDAVPTTGAYRPANHQPSGTTLDPFDPPGPGSSYGNPGPKLGGTATLASAFGAADANGTWKLFVRDFAGGDAGEIARGWSIEVLTSGGGGDTTAPETEIVTGPSGTIAQPSAEFTFSSSESGSFECSLDGAAFALCGSPKAYAGLSEGEHSFAVRAVDSAGNPDASPATRGFTVQIPEPPPPPPPPPPPEGSTDTYAPSVSISKLTVRAAKRSAKLTFTGSDDVTAAAALAFTCKLDSKPARPCSSPTALKKLKPGKHKVEVRAVDAAGNESIAAVKRFRVRKPPSR